MQINWGDIDIDLKDRLEPFLSDLNQDIPTPVNAIYLTGPSARGEFSKANPEINLLMIFDEIDTNLLDHISKLGRKYGTKGLRAPLLLTPEYLGNAHDVFPIEFLSLKTSHILLYGENGLDQVSIDSSHLRLQCERELRSWRLQLRQGYLRSAGDTAWLSNLFLEGVADIFPLLRAILVLLEGNPDAANTASLYRLEEKSGIDLSCIMKIWELRKAGKKLPKDKVFETYDLWEKALAELVQKVDGLNA